MNGSTANCNARSCDGPWQVDDVDEVYRTRRLKVTPKFMISDNGICERGTPIATASNKPRVNNTGKTQIPEIFAAYLENYGRYDLH